MNLDGENNDKREVYIKVTFRSLIGSLHLRGGGGLLKNFKFQKKRGRPNYDLKIQLLKTQG